MIVLLLLFSCVLGSPLFTTILYSDADVLPARVLLRSLRAHHPTLPVTVFALPNVKRSFAEPLFLHDNATFLIYKPDYILSQRFAYLNLFSLTSHSVVIHVHPHTLISSPMTTLFSCQRLCAAFHQPCSFSPRLMAIKPNLTDYAALVHLVAKLKSGSDEQCKDGNRADWLDEEGCILNAHFGKELLGAPLLTEGEGSEGEMRRLPNGWSVPHYLYYPRLRWEVPARCGTVKTIDFGTPSILRPWFWWTWFILDLTREWGDWRAKLTYPGRWGEIGSVLKSLTGFLLVTGVLVILIRRLKEREPGTEDEAEMMLKAVAFGSVFAGVSWVLGIFLTPWMIWPAYGGFLCVVKRSMVLWLMWMWWARWKRPATMSKVGGVLLMETLVGVSAVGIGGWLPAETGWDRVVWLLSGAVIYCISAMATVVVVAGWSVELRSGGRKT